MSQSICRGCGAQIVWLKTAAGKNMPVNAESVEVGDDQYEHGRHKPHWKDCPASDKFRSSK